MKKIYASLLILLSISSQVIAQNFHLVKDINRETNSFPFNFKFINGILYFSADDGIHGREIWRSDGTQNGTYLIKDINEGIANSDPQFGAELNGVIYFKAYTEEYGMELWRTDGTANGTYMVKDVVIGKGSGLISSDTYDNCWFTEAKSLIFFTAYTNKTGGELWRTDGTTEGTFMIKDLNKQYGSNPNHLIKYNNQLYLFATGNNDYDSLYKSDGTAAGTVGVQRINRSGIQHEGNSEEAIIMDSILYFNSNAVIGTDNIELWKSDGTTAGTHIVKEVNRMGSSNPNHFAVLNHHLYFSAYNNDHGEELWKTDGTDTGTFLVKDISKSDNYGSSIQDIVSFKNKIFYSYYGVEGFDTTINGLWQSDGTKTGTKRVISFDNSYELTSITSTMVFFRYDSLTGLELWKTDGTHANTAIVKDIQPGIIDGAKNYFLFNDSDYVYFDGETFASGIELWKSNGNEAHTKMVKDINVSASEGSGINMLSAFNGKLFFTAYNNVHGNEPYLSDGTSKGTYLLKDLAPNNDFSTPQLQNIVSFKDTLYFQKVSYINSNINLYDQWQSDGIPQGTLLKYSTTLGSSNYTPASNTIYFNNTDGKTGHELWRTNGNKSNTYLIKDIWKGKNSSYPKDFALLNNIAYFTAADSIHGQELWKSDGTAQGTKLVVDLNAGTAGSNPTSTYAYNNHLFFYTKFLDNKIWINDGTANTSFIVDSATNEPLTFLETKFIGSGNNVYFSAYTFATGYELWRCDGKGNKAVLMKDIQPGGYSSYISNFTDINGILYFTAADNSSYIGNYLWRSDGTAAGTYLVKDIFPGDQNFQILSLVNAGGVLAFLAKKNYNNPAKLWRSDGTEQGTHKINDSIFNSINFINSLYAINNRLYFVANNYEYGNELYTGIINNENRITANKDNDGAVTKAEAFDVKVFPAPFKNKLSVYISSPKSSKVLININSVDGKIIESIYTNINSGRNTINFATGLYNPGIYLVTVNDGLSKQTVKVIKQ